MTSDFHVLDDIDESEVAACMATLGLDRRTVVHLRELKAVVDEQRLAAARELRARGEEEIDLDEIALRFG